MLQDYPVPPPDPAMPWQPPYEQGEVMAPPVQVETYGQKRPDLQIVPPPATAPGRPEAVVDAYLVNNYGGVLTNLYSN